jgi:hypothetical protein
MLADTQAGAAADAALRPKDQLRLLGLAFGVVAPPAVQWASLEEDRGANPWAIVDGELLDIKDVSFDQDTLIL